MKRYKDLFDKIVDLDNLYEADRKARRNKTHRLEIIEFDKNKDELLRKLRDNLINETYTTSEYFTFTIKEPKERLIFKLPYYPDRIVHHAIMNIMEPIWLSVFINNTYSCIKKRGIHKALKDVKKAMKDKDNTEYCLKLDIRKFYPSIDHDQLKVIVRKKIKDTKLLRLLDNIIDSTDGVPIGNYLSQFFANLFLTYFDHWLKEVKKVKYYFRYADDIIILHKDKSYLHDLLKEIKQYIGNIKLDIKANHLVFRVEDRGVSFVGYVIYHDHVLLRKNIKRNMCRKAARLNKKKDLSLEDYKQQMCSHMGWAQYCNSRNLLRKILWKEALLDDLNKSGKQKHLL